MVKLEIRLSCLKFFVPIAIFGLLSVSAAGAEPSTRVELTDGSILRGEVLSYSDGVYRFNSDVLGTVALPREKIRSIQPAPPSAATGPDATLHPNRAGFRELQRQLQEQMQKDPETLRWIQELQNHPDIQTILNDEALMRAIEQGRLDRVSRDPKIQKLLNNETVGKIIEKNQPSVPDESR